MVRDVSILLDTTDLFGFGDEAAELDIVAFHAVVEVERDGWVGVARRRQGVPRSVSWTCPSRFVLSLRWGASSYFMLLPLAVRRYLGKRLLSSGGWCVQ
jgi:hypothetical protein